MKQRFNPSKFLKGSEKEEYEKSKEEEGRIRGRGKLERIKSREHREYVGRKEYEKKLKENENLRTLRRKQSRSGRETRGLKEKSKIENERMALVRLRKQNPRGLSRFARSLGRGARSVRGQFQNSLQQRRPVPQQFQRFQRRPQNQNMRGTGGTYVTPKGVVNMDSYFDLIDKFAGTNAGGLKDSTMGFENIGDIIALNGIGSGKFKKGQRDGKTVGTKFFNLGEDLANIIP